MCGRSAIGPMLGVDDPDPSAFSAERGTQRAAPRSGSVRPDGVNQPQEAAEQPEYGGIIPGGPADRASQTRNAKNISNAPLEFSTKNSYVMGGRVGGGWAPQILKIFENAKSFLIRRGVHHQNLGKGGAVRALAASSFYAGKSN